jgi:hypothetical protein
MKLAIVGSREFTDYNLLEKTILQKYNNIEAIVSGGAIGTDKLAERFANKHGIPTIIHKPDWKTYGKSAGYIRNKLIVDDCDEVIAFWLNQSKGTKLTIDIAKEKGKPCEAIVIDE